MVLRLLQLSTVGLRDLKLAIFENKDRSGPVATGPYQGYAR